MKRFSLMGVGLLVVLNLGAGAAGASTVHITNVSLSPQILLALYQSAQNNPNSLSWPGPTVLQIAVQVSGTTSVSFNLEIWDRSTQIAGAGPFHILKPVHDGMNIFSAGDISAQNLAITFDSKYAPNFGSNGQVNLPSGPFQVRITPANFDGTPNGDPSYTLTLSLFTPPSALNQPPVPIYPKDVEVNTLLPVFSWTVVPKALGYEISLGPDPNPESNTYWRSERLSVNQALYPPSGRALENGVKYYWQVRAFDEFGNPIGGSDGRSQPAAFTINSSAMIEGTVAAADVEAVLKPALPDPALMQALAAYQVVAVETDCPALGELLKQIRAGSAKVISAQVE